MDSEYISNDMLLERFKKYSRLTAYKSGVDAGYNKKLNEIPESTRDNEIKYWNV